MRYGAVIVCKECTVTMGGIKFSFVAPSVSAMPNTGCNVRTTRVAETITIPGQTVQLVQVSILMDEPMDVPTN